jgi:hypothetical protein
LILKDFAPVPSGNPSGENLKIPQTHQEVPNREPVSANFFGPISILILKICFEVKGVKVD